MKALSIACFADAGLQVGSGHIFRVYPVLEALIERSASTKMFSPLERKEIAKMNLKNTCAGDAARFSRERAETVLVDSYRERKRLLATDSRLVLFDDHYAPLEGPEVIINASPAATLQRYAGNPAKLLLGPRYASLDRAFRAARGRFRVRSSLRQILVALGGNDTMGSLGKVVETLQEVFPEATLVVCGAPEAKIAAGPKVKRHPWLDQARVAQTLAGSDLAVLAGGQMLVQAACVGVPAISLPQSDNQILHASAWQKIGSALVIKSRAQLGRAASRLRSRESRAAMSAAGRATVDGLGAHRVAAALLN